MQLVAVLSSSDGDMDFVAEEVRRRFRRVEANDLQEVEPCLDDLVPVPRIDARNNFISTPTLVRGRRHMARLCAIDPLKNP
jgi:hypothetical protein